MRTITHLSDIHFGVTDPTIVEGVVADVNAAPPTLVVMSGDFTQRARSWQFRAAVEFMARLPGPQLVVPGNHDIPLYDVISRFLWPLRNYKRLVTKNLVPVYADGELLVVGINTARSITWTHDGFWKDGKISEGQLKDVKLHACALPDTVFKVVVTHHPFIPAPGERVHGIVHGAREALDQLEDCGIDMCLAGHLHMGYSGDVRTHHEAVKRSILSVQAGTATSTRVRKEPQAYNRITINPVEVTVQVRVWDGGKFVDGARTHFLKREGVWNRQP